MTRKSMKIKIEEYLLRKTQDRMEKDRQRYDKDYKLEQDGSIPDRR